MLLAEARHVFMAFILHISGMNDCLCCLIYTLYVKTYLAIHLILMIINYKWYI